MKRLFATFGLACALFHPLAVSAAVIDFDSLSGYTDTSSSGSYYNGYGLGAPSGAWSVDGATFNTNEFGPGWSYSNVNNAAEPGFMNQFAAFTGTGVGGSGNYVIGTSFEPEFPAYFTVPDATRISSIYVTNTTYAALAMQDGYFLVDRFGGVSGEVADFFKVTFTGYSETNPNFAANPSITGAVDFFLADYRFADNADDYIVDSWELLDLTPLGAAKSVAISFSGSQNNNFGLAIPAYVAIDNLTVVTAVPEPTSFGAIAIAAAGAALLRRRKRLSCM